MMQSSGLETMKSGELAKLTGVSADTLHHYEKMGVLVPASRQDNGYRHYTPDAVQRVQLIQRALRLGFTLGELAPILKERDGGGAPCESVKRLAAAKLKEIDARLEELTQLRTQFSTMIEQWENKLAKTAKGAPARLLDQLPTLDKASSRPTLRPRRSQR